MLEDLQILYKKLESLYSNYIVSLKSYTSNHRITS